MSIKQFLKVLLFITILSAYAYVIYKHYDQIIFAVSSNSTLLLLVSACLIIGIFIQSYNYLDILKPEKHINALPTFRIWVSSSLFNYVAFFQPGLLLRAKYFKNCGVSYIDSSIAVAKQLHYNVWIGIGLASFALPQNDSSHAALKIILAIIFIIWMPTLRPITKFASKFLAESKKRKLQSLASPPTMKQAIFCLSFYIITSVIFYILLKEFDINTSFSECILLSVFLTITSLIAVTPNNIGIQEVVIGIFVHSNGSSGIEYITIPFIFRLCHILSCTITAIAISISLKNFNITNKA